MDPNLNPTDDLPSRADLARELLLYKMREYFQDAYCASWLVGIEIELWDLAEREAPTERESYAVTTSKECRRLAGIAGGWWAWHETAGRKDGREIFITLDEWENRLAIRKAERG